MKNRLRCNDALPIDCSVWSSCIGVTALYAVKFFIYFYGRLWNLRRWILNEKKSFSFDLITVVTSQVLHFVSAISSYEWRYGDTTGRHYLSAIIAPTFHIVPTLSSFKTWSPSFFSSRVIAAILTISSISLELECYSPLEQFSNIIPVLHILHNNSCIWFLDKHLALLLYS